MSATSSRRLLIIAYYYPPIKSIAVLRTYQFSLKFEESLEKVVLLTTSNRNYLETEPLPIPDIHIEEIPTLDYRRIFSFLSGKKKTHLPAKSKKSFIARLWIALKDSFPTNLLLDEGGLIYIILGILKGRRLIKSQQLNTVYSSFRPYADHLIGWALKCLYPHLIWIADFRDLQVDTNRNNVYWPKLQNWFNQKILAKADLLTTVSDGLAVPLKAYHKNVVAIRNGVYFRNRESNQNRHKFTICHTGSIYRGYRSPEILLSVLVELISEGNLKEQELNLVYAGKDSLSWTEWINKYKLEAYFSNHGMLPREEALKLQENAHLNLLMSWAGPKLKGLLTGKFYEYLGAQRPILLIIKGDKDPEFEHLFKELNAGLVIYESDREALKSYLLQLIKEWRSNGRVEGSFNQSALEKMNWSSRANDLINEIEALK